ncbi:DNA polymerase I [Clostridium swellfunianum]|uniref:DNA polymerase I n=1 Tax=Clostridium swellfunianum TaxID=1367462 RepID=UPI00202FA61D|nr:DNA polymerase I [Clostridium swellfunianum]MCM0648494.1 DNA polymerase I [Clostridium swellfunianum]
MVKERLIILDGHSLMNRAFYALPPLTNAEGLHTNALYGFTAMLFKMQEEIKPNYIVCTFDRKAPTFRHEEYKDYKAGRKKMPPELGEQFPVLKELLELMSINIFEIDGFEADDLIGTLSKFAEKKDIEVYIVTGDRDALQLASDNIKVVITKKGMSEKEIYDSNRMVEEFGVTPTQFIDVKGLMGDSSDNIPGVPGIGEKTAYKLIQQYGSVENVLQNIDNISGAKIKNNLIEYREQAIFSKKLATIITNVPIDIDLDSIKSNERYDITALRQMFFRLQFKSLLDKLPQVEISETPTSRTEEALVEYETVDTIEKLNKAAQNIKEELFMYLETENLHIYSKADINRIYINSQGKYYVVDFKKLKEEDEKSLVEVLKPIFEDKTLMKIGHDNKSTFLVFRKYGIKLKGVAFDTKIAAYLIDSSKGEYELTTLIQELLKIDIIGEGEELYVKFITYLPQIKKALEEKVHEFSMEKLFYEVELPLTEVLAFMETEGFKVDKEKLEELGKKFRSEIDKVQEEIYELAGDEFNIGSPKQLGKILFEKLDLPVVKKTKTGYSTNAEVLEELSDKHPIIDKITYYRQLTKLHSTYVEGLKNVIDFDNKIHSSLNQAVTTTGRLSSTEPNLQNIPIKYEMGREIRKIFVSNNENSVILSADYSQIELRVLAHIADDENLIDAFVNHSDIHTKTASEVFRVPIEEVTSLMRSRAKAVNFGIVYGIGDFSLAKDIKVTKKEAKNYIDAYFERYPNVKKYMEDIVRVGEDQSFVTTILNRRRYIPEISSSNKVVKALGIRLAMNTPIQGSAADIIKLAMVNVHKQLTERNLMSTLILQVHDELILNVYKNEINEVQEIVKKEMEQVFNLRVPLEVDINIGDTWYEAK